MFLFGFGYGLGFGGSCCDEFSETNGVDPVFCEETLNQRILHLLNDNISKLKEIFNNRFGESEIISEFFKTVDKIYRGNALKISDLLEIKSFFKDKHILNESLSGVSNYESLIEEFDELLGKKEIDKVNDEDVGGRIIIDCIYFFIVNDIIIFLEKGYIGGFKEDYLLKELLVKKYESLEKWLVENGINLDVLS